VQELVQVGIGDLFDRLNVVAWDQLVVGVEEFDSDLLECSLREQETLDSRETLVRIIVCLLDQGQLFSLRLVESTVNRVRLF
jgi:hypothetical protein